MRTVHKTKWLSATTCHIDRSPILRQYCICRLIRFFLCLAASIAQANIPRSTSPLCNAKSRGIGSDLVPPRRQRAGRDFLPGRDDAGDGIKSPSNPIRPCPVTIYYAFKQSETSDEGEGDTVSTGWDTFLEAVIRAGFAITGTWPMRTERGARSISIGTNALASSIIIVCRRRAIEAPNATPGFRKRSQV